MVTDSFKLNIVRRAIASTSTTDGAAISGYYIEATCSVTENADPNAVRLDQNVFVRSVTDNAFVRVASASDLGLLYSSRDSAITAGHTEYRDSVGQFNFADIDTAVSAIPVLKDRVNTLLYNFVQYSNEFLSEDKYSYDYSLPTETIDASKSAEYIAEYTESRAARLASDAEIASSQALLDSVSYKKDYIADVEKAICDSSTTVGEVHTALDSVYTTLINSNSGVQATLVMLNTLVESNSQYPLAASDYSQLKNILTTINTVIVPAVDSAKTTISTKAEKLGLECAAQTNQLDFLTNHQSTLESSLTSLVSENKLSSQQEQSALASLAKYCPGVNPDNL
tara:strand:+ start:382 stop:1398 length:1017 start_codon:yes stop_codon:yes gene_type:complete